MLILPCRRGVSWERLPGTCRRKLSGRLGLKLAAENGARDGDLKVGVAITAIPINLTLIASDS